MSTLTAEQKQILAFEREWFKFAGAKESAIRDQFELSMTVYYRTLNALLDDGDALAYDPMTVRRLRRLRDVRRARRTG